LRDIANFIVKLFVALLYVIAYIYIVGIRVSVKTKRHVAPCAESYIWFVIGENVGNY